MTAHPSTPSAVPDPNTLELADLAAALRLGWRDFLASPFYGLFFSLVYVAGGWLIAWALTSSGQVWWTLIASAGFPILGPFIACGYYEISRRLEMGERLTWGGILGVIFRQKDRQIPSMAAVVVVFFLFWNFLAHMIFALFMGLSTMTNISSSYGVFLTPNGLAMLAVGTVVGGIFALLLYMITVIALPLASVAVPPVVWLVTDSARMSESPISEVPT